MNCDAELMNLFHLAKTALSNGDTSTWSRMCWAAREFNKLHPEITSSNAYKRLEAQVRS